MRKRTLTIPCLYTLPETDDYCYADVEVHVFPQEKATMTYPGSPAGFEVLRAPCGHGEYLETTLKDILWGRILDELRDADESHL